jgi:hypothetical protein
MAAARSWNCGTRLRPTNFDNASLRSATSADPFPLEPVQSCSQIEITLVCGNLDGPIALNAVKASSGLHNLVVDRSTSSYATFVPKCSPIMIFGLDSNFTSWGPFINHDTFIIQPVTPGDLATAIVVFVIVFGFAASAAYVGYKQTKRSREPWKSAYIWMVWAEWASCLLLAILCMLFIVRAVRPSFYFFMVICM